jgi:hypothetical protein
MHVMLSQTCSLAQRKQLQTPTLPCHNMHKNSCLPTHCGVGSVRKGMPNACHPRKGRDSPKKSSRTVETILGKDLSTVLHTLP